MSALNECYHSDRVDLEPPPEIAATSGSRPPAEPARPTGT